MTNKEINIKSSTIEKGLDLAKDFLSKLISPTAEEIGLLISDNVKYVRFKNQIRILLKARDYVEKKKLNIKAIPIKILVPLLDNASLEDDENIQDKWAKMLVNMVDSESNLQNQIFPYLLSQISIQEFDELKTLIIKETEYLTDKKKLYELKEADQYQRNDATRRAQKKITIIEQDGFSLFLEEFEIANLLRLGLIRQLPPRIYIQEFKTGGHDSSPHREEWHSIDAEYNTDTFGYRVTQLGEKFIEICELTDSVR